MTASMRCNWILKNGRQCTKTAYDGRDYCYVHWRITCHETDEAIKRQAPSEAVLALAERA